MPDLTAANNIKTLVKE